MFPHSDTSQGRADIWPAALELIDELNRFLERLATACSNRSITVDQLVAVTATRSRFLSLLCTVQLSKLTDDYLIRLEQGAIEFRNVRAALRVIMGFAQELGKTIVCSYISFVFLMKK